MEPITADALAARLGRWSAGRGPLYLLLAGRLRALIDEGELPPDTLLPADRALATALAVGRTTAVAAYDLLRAEGRLVRRQGSGTRVAAPALPGDRPARPGAANPLFVDLLDPPADVISLICAAPDAPPPELAKAHEKALPRLANITGDLGLHPLGHPALREALAGYYTGRGVPTEPAQIFVTDGAQHALSLLARLLLAPGDEVLTEAPSYPGALEAFREAAAVLQAIPVGRDGLDPAAWHANLESGRARLGYLIPTHQNPVGTVVPGLVRRRLVHAARAAEVPLIDDEVLTELGFSGQAPAPLAAHAPDGGVITVGSLSKIVWGGLRIGWIRASAALVTRLARLRTIDDLSGNVLAQLAAAELVADLDGLRERRVETLRRRHDHLCAELERHLPDWSFRPASGGQTLWVQLPAADATSFAQIALRHGVAVLPGSSLDATGGSENYLRLPFLAPPDVLSDAVRRLAGAWMGQHAATGRRSAVPAVVV